MEKPAAVVCPVFFGDRGSVVGAGDGCCLAERVVGVVGGRGADGLAATASCGVISISGRVRSATQHWGNVGRVGGHPPEPCRVAGLGPGFTLRVRYRNRQRVVVKRHHPTIRRIDLINQTVREIGEGLSQGVCNREWA